MKRIITEEELNVHMRTCELCNSVPDDPYGICPYYTEHENQVEVK